MLISFFGFIIIVDISQNYKKMVGVLESANWLKLQLLVGIHA